MPRESIAWHLKEREYWFATLEDRPSSPYFCSGRARALRSFAPFSNGYRVARAWRKPSGPSPQSPTVTTRLARYKKSTTLGLK